MAGAYRYQHGDKPLDGYTILRGIGRGGFGEVYYAVSEGGREVAIKAIQQNHDIELRGVGHCINLKSPHLISIFDVKKNADGVPFVIMEYVAGPSLRGLLPRDGRGVGLARACFLLREIARGLGYLHERGIVHRDLKPENIFVEDGYVKIGDYGLSKYISVSRQSGQTISVGTVHYMAPEIGSGNYHQGIDVYSLGIIFYELLTGNVPFNGDSMGEILMKHLTCEPDVSVLEPALRPIVKKALAKSPGDRFQSAREMVDAVLALEGVASQVAAVDPQSLSGSTRNGAGVAAAGALASPTAETTPVTPAPTPVTWTDRRSDPARAPDAPAPVAPLPGYGFPLSARLVPGLATAAAVSLALGLLLNRSAVAAFGHLAALGTLSLGILWVEQWFVPRYGIQADLVRRLVTLGLVGPLILLVVAPLSSTLGLGGEPSLLAFVAGLVCVDWGARTRPQRGEHISIGLAVSAAIFGAVAGAIAGGKHMAPLAAFFAGLSVVLNAISPFAPQSERKAHRARGEDRRPAAPPPQTAHVPAAPVAARPPLPAPAPFQAPAPLPPPLPGPAPIAPGNRMSRPRRERVFAGVCAALARHFGWETAIVRVIFAVTCVAGLPVTLLIYAVLWISIPNEPLPQVALATTPVPRPRRSLAVPLAVGLLIALGIAVMSSYVVLRESPVIPTQIHGAGSHPLTATKLGLAPLVLLGTAFLATFVFVIVRRARGKVQGTGSGWSSFGTLLIVLAGLMAAADVHFKLRWAEDLFGDAVSRERLGPSVHDFLEGRGLAMSALVNFAAGSLCVAIGRRRGGAWHVLRGLAGCAGVGLLVALPLVHARELRESAPAPQELLGWCLLLVSCLIILTWPARRALAAPPPSVPAPQEMAA